MLEITPIPAFQDNYIWLIRQAEGHDVFVVDPGDATPVIEYLEAENLNLAGILITHHHADHTGGVAELISKYEVCAYGPDKSPFRGATHTLEEGDEVEVLGTTLKVKRVPGHTLDHICYYRDDEEQALVFCGDTLFMAGCGRLFEGTPAQMLEAMNFFDTLPGKTHVYCTHEYSLSNLAFAQAVEPENKHIQFAVDMCTKMRQNNKPTLPSTIALEQNINPFMRTDQGSVIYAASRQAGQPLSEKGDVLAAIREWKNNF